MSAMPQPPQQQRQTLTDVKTLREQVRTSLPAEPRSLKDEIPPHY